MSPERWQQVQEILDLVLDADPEHRRAVLEEACADDSLLLADAESFLAHQADLASNWRDRRDGHSSAWPSAMR